MGWQVGKLVLQNPAQIPSPKPCPNPCPGETGNSVWAWVPMGSILLQPVTTEKLPWKQEPICFASFSHDCGGRVNAELTSQYPWATGMWERAKLSCQGKN